MSTSRHSASLDNQTLIFLTQYCEDVGEVSAEALSFVFEQFQPDILSKLSPDLWNVSGPRGRMDHAKLVARLVLAGYEKFLKPDQQNYRRIWFRGLSIRAGVEDAARERHQKQEADWAATRASLALKAKNAPIQSQHTRPLQIQGGTSAWNPQSQDATDRTTACFVEILEAVYDPRLISVIVRMRRSFSRKDGKTATHVVNFHSGSHRPLYLTDEEADRLKKVLGV